MHILPVLERLTYRYPSVLVDAVTHYEPGRRIVAVKNVTVNEEFFQGHFPGNPVMPGVLVLEAMAQVAGIALLGVVPDKEKKLLYLSGVDRCKFRRPVVPGDQLRIEAELVSVKMRACKCRATATVDGQVCCEADLLSASFLMDTAQYYMFVVIPAYKIYKRYHWMPVLGPKEAFFAYHTMVLYNRRFRRIALARRAMGEADRRNAGRRIKAFYNLDHNPALMGFRGARLWLRAELDYLRLKVKALFSGKLRSSVDTGGGKMANLQIALHKETNSEQTALTIGIPVITGDYSAAAAESR